MWKSRPMVGSATFTIVMSMMFMNIAETKTTPTAIFWFMRATATWISRYGVFLGSGSDVGQVHAAPASHRPYALAPPVTFSFRRPASCCAPQ